MTFLPNGSSYLWHSSAYLLLSCLLKNSLKVASKTSCTARAESFGKPIVLPAIAFGISASVKLTLTNAALWWRAVILSNGQRIKDGVLKPTPNSNRTRFPPCERFKNSLQAGRFCM